MKKLFEDSGYRMSETEQEEVWRRITQTRQRPTPTRWLFRPAVVTVTVAVAGLFIFMLIRDRDTLIIDPGEMKSLFKSPAREIREDIPEPAVAASDYENSESPIPDSGRETEPLDLAQGGVPRVADGTPRETDDAPMAKLRRLEQQLEPDLALAVPLYDESDKGLGDELEDAAAAPPPSTRSSTVASPEGRDRSAAVLQDIT
ncbi:MAG: hypothetical protein ABIF77_16895, partial [bacterium]